MAGEWLQSENRILKAITTNNLSPRMRVLMVVYGLDNISCILGGFLENFQFGGGGGGEGGGGGGSRLIWKLSEKTTSDLVETGFP